MNALKYRNRIKKIGSPEFEKCSGLCVYQWVSRRINKFKTYDKF